MIKENTKIPCIKVSDLDLVVLVTVLLESIVFWKSMFSWNSTSGLISAFSLFFLYILIRRFSKYIHSNREIIYVVLLTICSLLTVWFVYRIVMFHIFFYQLGLLHLIQEFRHFFKPLNLPNSDLGIILIIIFAFTLMVRNQMVKYTQFINLLLGVQIGLCLATGSRGVFISILVFVSVYLTVTILVKPYLNRSGIEYLLFGFLLLAIPFKNLMARATFMGSQSYSATRSAEARMDMSILQDLPHEKQAFGLGSGNALLFRDYAFPDKSFSTKISNGFVKLLLEKGIVGLLIYISLFLYVFLKIGRRIMGSSAVDSQHTKIVILALLSSLIVGEVFNDVVHNPIILIVLTSILAVEANRDSTRITVQSRVFLSLIILMLIGIVHASWKGLSHLRYLQIHNYVIDNFEVDSIEVARNNLLKLSEPINPVTENLYYLTSFEEKTLFYYPIGSEMKISSPFKQDDVISGLSTYLPNPFLVNSIADINKTLVKISNEDDSGNWSLDQCLIKYPENGYVNITGAIHLFNTGEKEAGFELLCNAIEKSPSILFSPLMQSFLLREQEWVASLQLVLKKQILKNINSSTPADWAKAGSLYLFFQDYVEAQYNYLRALEKVPSFSTTRRNLGIAYYYQGNIRLAVKELMRTISMDPSDYLAYFYLAKLSRKEGRDFAAQRFYQLALKSYYTMKSEDYFRHSYVYRIRVPSNQLIGLQTYYYEEWLNVREIIEDILDIYKQSNQNDKIKLLEHLLMRNKVDASFYLNLSQHEIANI